MTDTMELERAVRRRMAGDFPHFAAKCLKIRTKVGAVQPLSLNTVQQEVQALAEEQRKKTGRVRALLLKGRQQGMSTFVEARLFHQTIHRLGCRSFILTHHADATANLFSMAKRYYENLPPILQPDLGASSMREMTFPAIDSGYKVGTAGTEGVGRSDTIQLFHGSEVAFWPHADEHAAGVLQAVPDAPGTEVWLESTANGLGNFFHSMWQDASRGKNRYLPIFLQWWKTPEYRAALPVGGQQFEPEEREYQREYGIDDEQLLWRRNKIAELGDSKFRQEYPANPVEAFEASIENALIDPHHVMAAKQCELQDDAAFPLIIGVDPARFGDDDTAVIRRKQRRAFGLERWRKLDTMEVAGKLGRIIDQEKPVKVFIDVGGLGAGVYDRLRELGYRQCHPVNFGEKALDPATYKNKRAEMWGAMRDWLAEPPVDIPDDDTLHADLTTPMYSYDSNQRLVLERKEDMRKRGISSPDAADALALTFAYPVSAVKVQDRYERKRYEQAAVTSWMSS